MPENARLTGCLDEIQVDFVERKATPRLLTKLGIQLHLAELSLLNTILILEVSGVERARSTVHNWVHNAELQPGSGRSPDHVAVDETDIWLDSDKYWLYAAVDPEMNDLLHKDLKHVTTGGLAWLFLRKLRGKHDI